MAARNVLQRETSYFDILSAFHNLYFITLTWVKKLSKYFYFDQSFFTQISIPKVKSVCTPAAQAWVSPPSCEKISLACEMLELNHQTLN